MISITGSSGKTGKAITKALVARGAPVRALIHREDRASEMTVIGATEAAVADLTDRSALAKALAGSSVVCHICPNMRPDEVEIGERVIDVCRQVGVERFVYYSVLHPQIEAMPHHWNKLRLEEKVIESGLDFTIFQPAAYMQNLQAQWGSVVENGMLEVPYAASTKLGMVDLRDVAEAAARVLTKEGHGGAVYELCGPEVMDQNEVASVLSQALGRLVEVLVQDRDVWAEGARRSGLGAYGVESLVAMFEHYERHGFAGNSRTLEGLLGRPPASLGSVVARWTSGVE